MKVLFITMSKMSSIERKGIYADLMRKFRKEGHNLFIVTPVERRDGCETMLTEEGNARILAVKTLNVQKSNVIEKGLGQLSIEYLFKNAIKKYWGDIHFDLILYSTPPITLPKVIEYCRHRSPEAQTYLLLKDIFPQNAVDLGMMKKSGVKGILYRFFRKKEKKLYALSDHIGCMSPANVQYVISHNPEVSPSKVELAPNSCEVVLPPSEECYESKIIVREKYGLPADKPIFIYGGNMGKPQGVPFIIKCLDACKNRDDCHFVIVGSGTEYPFVEAWQAKNHPRSVSVFKSLPKEDYDALVSTCDIGLIFLDYRFTIPNYPSRLLSCLMERKPIIACTDLNCDTGTIAEQNGYGFWCPSNDVQAFVNTVDKMLQSDIVQMGENGYRFFLENYTVDKTYNAIMKHLC